MTEQLAPRCPRCRRRHNPALRCWSGRYAQQVTAHVLRTQGTVCWIGGERATTADHVIPRSRWGDDTDTNLRPCCSHHNSQRGNKANPFDPEPPVRRSGLPLSSRWTQ